MPARSVAGYQRCRCPHPRPVVRHQCLLVTSRTGLSRFQKPFALDQDLIGSFVEAAKELRPTGIIDVNTVPKLFNQPVIKAMAKINERPIMFPYPNWWRKRLVGNAASAVDCLC